MGNLVPDHYVPGLLQDLNLRFSPGDSLNEMIALQKEFKIFAKGHSLQKSFALLNIGPLENWQVRRGWNKYLDILKKLPSDKTGESAHDRLVSLLKAHLSLPDPLPIYFISHSTAINPGLTVQDVALAIAYSAQSYLTISLPMTPIDPTRVRGKGKSK
ncbi:MAG TPA: hypothetical protein VNT30_02860 [Stellaceae bacterium]|nr:hypothetical protein [Stellaceae bacterium]